MQKKPQKKKHAGAEERTLNYRWKKKNLQQSKPPPTASAHFLEKYSFHMVRIPHKEQQLYNKWVKVWQAQNYFSNSINPQAWVLAWGWASANSFICYQAWSRQNKPLVSCKEWWLNNFTFRFWVRASKRWHDVTAEQSYWRTSLKSSLVARDRPWSCSCRDFPPTMPHKKPKANLISTNNWIHKRLNDVWQWLRVMGLSLEWLFELQ